jgi:hypothetical protein
MKNYKVMRLFIPFLFVGFVGHAESYGYADESYSPGPVVVLHTWLGEQCSFAPDFDIGECCAVHDMAYQSGGSAFQRWLADREFRDCIRAEGRPIIAWIYYWGVRWFGWIFFNYS